MNYLRNRILLYKSLLRELCEPIRVTLFCLKWRKLNSHNKTLAGSRFPIGKVKVGKGTYGRLNVFTYNDPNSSCLYIGNFCSIARTAIFLLSGNHPYTGLTTYPLTSIYLKEARKESKGDIVIDDDVWIAERCTILSGVHIGKGAIIAAGSVVSKDIPPYAIFGGGKIIKYRFSPQLQQELIHIDYSRIDYHFVEKFKHKIDHPLQIDDIEWLSSLRIK